MFLFVMPFRVCEAITTDIFHSVGIQKHEAEECFGAIAQQISNARILHHFKLESFRDVDWIRRRLSQVVRLQAKTGKIVCPPAHIMGCIVAAVAYRKLLPENEGFFDKNKGLVKVFGELNSIQWLSVAVQMWNQVKSKWFIIELDEARQKPVAELRNWEGSPFWFVTTSMPAMNKYENVLRSVLCPGGPAVQPAGPTIPKLERSDNALPSIEPNDTTNEPIAVSDDDESEDNAMTLRDFTRQMKILGKRLATPDRTIARRARREILKKPDEVRDKEAVEDGPLKEYFDSYTHLKDVWRTFLQNGVSIPNSLRVLVDHHCTPSQVFHLTELEKEHQMEMEVDG
ncbi:hypothetical protein J7337_004884 [Fusarium musae]|uniref:Uncharacterized protein n=1 Tax=Fusarium musae TaxID=1042133 RepID=A0A9P8IT61_9HYPO|nr:hypothetical protein J7337_004884 [Fusarium musae]KAG9504904.1 hypothetical protein J7337_004884 [Fusarium musae]